VGRAGQFCGRRGEFLADRLTNLLLTHSEPRLAEPLYGDGW
jgi:hypothetical protein